MLAYIKARTLAYVTVLRRYSCWDC